VRCAAETGSAADVRRATETGATADVRRAAEMGAAANASATAEMRATAPGVRRSAASWSRIRSARQNGRNNNDGIYF
jgi:hypothetical protein